MDWISGSACSHPSSRLVLGHRQEGHITTRSWSLVVRYGHHDHSTAHTDSKYGYGYCPVSHPQCRSMVWTWHGHYSNTDCSLQTVLTVDGHPWIAIMMSICIGAGGEIEHLGGQSSPKEPLATSVTGFS